MDRSGHLSAKGFIMNKYDGLDARNYQLAVVELFQKRPDGLALFTPPSRFERMSQELHYAIRHSSQQDINALLGHLARDSGSAVVRRASAVWDLLKNLSTGSLNEVEGMVKAYSADNLSNHIAFRLGNATGVTTRAISSGTKSFVALAREIWANPADAAPKLLVLVFASVAASGGIDGNGGLPDTDIPLMGIGAHRSPFTHSIIVGSLLEAALLLLTRIVIGTHKNLPAHHDPLWDSLARRSVELLEATGKGASIGIAYHLMIDAVVQPGTYHGLPFDMPLEAHQAVLAGNSVAEGSAVRSYPDEEAIVATPELITAHKKYRSTQMELAPALKEWLTEREIALLVKYGAWLQALAKRDILPTTMAQVRFLKVSAGQLTATTDYEKAWTALAEAKDMAGSLTKKSKI